MESVSRQLQNKNISERTRQLQERILSRMLDSQRSIHRRDFSKKRSAERAKQYRAVDPGELPDDLGESKQLLKELLERALKEGYKRDFEDLIRKYFENLNRINARVKMENKN